MASEVDICNLALARLGDTATVASLSPPEGSAQAEHCAIFYPISRDALLEMHAWGFATRHVQLAKRAMVDNYAWQFAYAVPNDVIKLLGVLPPDWQEVTQTQPYEVVHGQGAMPCILTNQDNAVLRYVVRVEDTLAFSPLFVDALAWLLASNLAGPLTKGQTGAQLAQTCYRNFMVALGQAVTSDANQHKMQQLHQPEWIGAR